jgi:hypothetical protein
MVLEELSVINLAKILTLRIHKVKMGIGAYLRVVKKHKVMQAILREEFGGAPGQLCGDFA